jgi:segregation and condensation protein A
MRTTHETSPPPADVGRGDASPYKVQVEVFEGPLDLLLHLIKKEDIDIYDIPISKLLEQYLDYLNLTHELNIDLAGEFLEMASELTYIKSKMLLPESEAEEEEGPDPRADLVARLLEYQRYKMAAQALISKPLLGRDVFARPPMMVEPETEESFIEADTLSLLSAFQDLLKRLPVEKFHEVRQPAMGVAERILELTEKLKGEKQAAFEDLFEGNSSRGDVVVTFLAILEMAKQKLLKIIQEKVFHKIYVCPLFSE